MGCLKLSYYEQGRALEVNPIFFTGAVEKKRRAEKNCLSSSTYGFNGQEKDDEVKGQGNSYDFNFRIQDVRLGGRFLSIDALGRDYPWYSPYQFAGNMPIIAIDIDGTEPDFIIDKTGKLTQPIIILLSDGFGLDEGGLKQTIWSNLSAYHQGAGQKRDFFTRKVKSIASSKALKTHGAITLGTDVIFKDDFKSISNVSFWVNLISHEQSHVQDYRDQGTSEFLDRYFGGDGTNPLDYNQVTEQLARGRATSISNLLKKHPEIEKHIQEGSIDKLQPFAKELRKDVAAFEVDFYTNLIDVANKRIEKLETVLKDTPAGAGKAVLSRGIKNVKNQIKDFTKSLKKAESVSK